VALLEVLYKQKMGEVLLFFLRWKSEGVGYICIWWWWWALGDVCVYTVGVPHRQGGRKIKTKDEAYKKEQGKREMLVS